MHEHLRLSCRVLIQVILAGILVSFSTAAELKNNPKTEIIEDLTRLSLEQLMDLPVTSVSKKKESLMGAGAAIYVLTQEDIRRLGVTSIPEALRRVPGMEVAQFNSNRWAISARGFNSIFASKLLVLIDGRSVYTPLFSGVYWDSQDTAMEDIERIEVIRGPGGTLWGENAVNGVINIITKNSKDTVGGLVSAGAGTEENGFSTARYGARITEDTHLRVFGKYFNRSDYQLPSGANGPDEWESGRGGFRMDGEWTENSSWTLQGDAYRGSSGQNVNLTTLSPAGNSQTNDNETFKGGNILARWKRDFSKESHLEVQMYYDKTFRKDAILQQRISTVDLEVKHRWQATERNEVTWGFNSRVFYDELLGGKQSSTTIGFNPSSDINHITGFFAQDEFQLIPGKLRFVAGSKMGWNSFTDFEVQPSGRVVWTPNDRHTVWGAVSRAVRLPSRSTDAFQLNVSATPTTSGSRVIQVNGNSALESEDLVAFEMGYRLKATEDLFFDVTGFYNYYNDLNSTEPQSTFVTTIAGTPPSIRLTIPNLTANKRTGESYGIEMAANWNVTDWWTLKSSFNWFDLKLTLDSDSRDTTTERVEGNSPEYQVNMSSMVDLPWNLEWDTHFYFTDRLPAIPIQAYSRLDVRLGWHPIENLEVSLSVLNLLDPHHPEFAEPRGVGGRTGTEVPRSAFSKLTWTW